jgi:hypothetical protein
VLFVGFGLLVAGAFAYVLYRKVEAYRAAYFEVGADRIDAPVDGVERDEFEWDRSDV